MPSQSGIQHPAGLRAVHGGPRYAFFRSISALVLREMSSSNARSPGGFLWAIGEPVLGLMFLVSIMSAGFKSPPMGTNFAIFYASGLLPFYAYMNLMSSVTQAVNASRQLLNYPRVTYIDAIIARIIVSGVTQLVIGCIVFSTILLYFETRTTLHLETLALSYGMALAFGTGMGIMNCTLVMRFPVWQKVWGVMMRPMFFISGIFFLVERFPSPYREWLSWNPLVHVTSSARQAFYYGYEPLWVSPFYVLSLTLVLTTLGLLFLRRYYRDFFEL